MLVQGWVTSCKANNSILGSGECCEGQEGGLKKPTEPGCPAKMDVLHPFYIMLQFQNCQGFPWQ